jgi:site-specific recombinase XerD
MTLQDAIRRYNAHIALKRLSYSGERHIKARIALLRHWFGAERELGSIGHDDMQALFSSEQFTGFSRATYNHYLANIRDFFLYFHQRGEIAINPTVTIETVKIEKRVIEFFTLEEFRLLLRTRVKYKCRYKPMQLEHQMRDLMILHLSGLCGLRNTEAREMQWKYVNFEYGEMTVKQGKNRKDRVVPMLPITLKFLKQEYKRRKPKPTGHLILNFVHPERVVDREVLNDSLRRMCKAAGIEKDWTHHHILRHTCATLFLRGKPNKRGMDIRVVAELLGHVDIKTTAQYLHVEKSFLHGEMKRCAPAI